MLRSAALTCLSKSSVLMEYNLSSIKYILHGGAKFTADVGFLNQVLLNSEMLQGYGKLQGNKTVSKIDNKNQNASLLLWPSCINS